MRLSLVSTMIIFIGSFYNPSITHIKWNKLRTLKSNGFILCIHNYTKINPMVATSFHRSIYKLTYLYTLKI